jgi:diguanylate cyclase (GGDEF)-like protein
MRALLRWGVRAVNDFVERGSEGTSPEIALVIRRTRAFGLIAFTLLFAAGLVIALLAGSAQGVRVSITGMLAFAICLHFMARGRGRYARLASHAGIGVLISAITTAALDLGGASPIIVTYPSLLILATMYMLGVRAAAFWTAVSLAALALVVFTADLPPPPQGVLSPGAGVMFASRGLVLLAVFVIASMGRRFEDRQTELLNFFARHDALTGLANRREFEQRLNLALARCRRYGRRAALLFVDLDGFKQVNDRFGHEAGDDVLRWVARTIEDQTRDTDVAGRIGGDEFLVLLEDVPEEKAATLYAARLLELLESRRGAPSWDFPVRASIGVSLYPDDGHAARELTRAADAGMYEAKRQGGQRVARPAPDRPAGS